MSMFLLAVIFLRQDLTDCGALGGGGVQLSLSQSFLWVELQTGGDPSVDSRQSSSFSKAQHYPLPLLLLLFSSVDCFFTFFQRLSLST
ncbi:hypothetical protein L873DRAFT_1813250 [Choiromyces venosus 120613-1]|uniref:Secreted protein n=1 Tax=Choiromyces venosus 120613-1 TaxID=1336337 RepID=A0A3N4JCT6_9PEZI|nr:hypothetical protein L873DRAFT_1813250 [Choiromyces venosus 120613-1]